MTKQTKIVAGVLAGAALGATLVMALTSNKNNAIKAKAMNWLHDLLAQSKDKLAIAGEVLKHTRAKA